MMRNLELRPAIMGGLMGLMMLAMLHRMLTGDGGGAPLLIFVLVHVAIGAVVVIGAVFAARLSPRMRALMARVHRPSRRHLASMLAGMIATAGLAHLILHKGVI